MQGEAKSNDGPFGSIADIGYAERQEVGGKMVIKRRQELLEL